jgi:hypothetical protein
MRAVMNTVSTTSPVTIANIDFVFIFYFLRVGEF